MARALKSGLLSDHYRPGVRLGYKRPVAFDPNATLTAPNGNRSRCWFLPYQSTRFSR